MLIKEVHGSSDKKYYTGRGRGNHLAKACHGICTWANLWNVEVQSMCSSSSAPCSAPLSCPFISSPSLICLFPTIHHTSWLPHLYVLTYFSLFRLHVEIKKRWSLVLIALPSICNCMFLPFSLQKKTKNKKREKSKRKRTNVEIDLMAKHFEWMNWRWRNTMLMAMSSRFARGMW